MNKDKITAMCHKVSDETGLTFNSVMTYYFLESVLRKLSVSKYNDKFIFKGGYILSNIVGLDSRSTVDIDFEKLSKACERTFDYRGTILDFASFKEMIDIILADKGFNDRWKAYANKNNYVKEISFENVIESLILIIEQIILIGTGTGTGKKI